MQADAHFVIGGAHAATGQPCQDYAVAKTLPGGQSYAIIADGCSSGGKTDVGARLVSLATARALESLQSPAPSLIQAIVRQHQERAFEAGRQHLGLNQTDLLATCGYVYIDPQQALVHLQGDGVVAWRLGDGSLWAVRFEWAGNTPAYPAYAQDDFASFLTHHGDTSDDHLSVSYWRLAGDEPSYQYHHQTLSASSGAQGVTLQLPQAVRAAGVLTDGVNQVKGLPWTQVLQELMNFKTTNGQFVTRRLNRFIRDGAKSGHAPIDDLAYAVVSLEPEEEQ